LKSGYGILFKSITEDYVKMNNEWLDMATDVAEMCCVVEYSNDKTIAIDEPLYIYNKDNSILYDRSYYNSNRNEMMSLKRLKIHEYIKKLPKCHYSVPHIYIINLKCDDNKKRNMLKQLNLLDTTYQFVEAVDGYQTTNDDVPYIKYELYHDYLLKMNKKYNFDDHVNLKSKYNLSKKHITPGSFGLLQSVFKTLELFVETDLTHMLLLEDDVYTLKNFHYYLFINSKLLLDKDIVYLGCHNNRDLIYESCTNDKDVYINIKKYNFLVYGTYSIIISKKIAKYILNIGLEKILELNLSWDLFLNFLRETVEDLTFFLYFKQLFVPDVLKPGIQDMRDNTFYTQRKINLNDYERFLMSNTVKPIETHKQSNAKINKT
jgi:GR25 family glycosyltransferase involved in LPS biosynthesis